MPIRARSPGPGSVDRETLDGVSLERTALDRIGVLLSSGAPPSLVVRDSEGPGIPNKRSLNNLGNTLRATETDREARNPINMGAIN
jgi:hypothetical protein